MEYLYECPLPGMPVLPEQVDTMSHTTELLTPDYLKCFCVGTAATLSRSGHRCGLKMGRVTFIVPTAQLLLLRAAMSAAPRTQVDSDDDAEGDEPKTTVCGGGSERGASQGRKRRAVSKTPAKVIGYTKQTLAKVDKVLQLVTTMSWGKESTEKLYTQVTSKLAGLTQYRADLDRLQLRSGDQSILIRMTSATRQLKVVQEMLQAFRTYFRDAADTARTRLLEALSSLDKSYATAFDTIAVSTAVLLEAGSVESRDRVRVLRLPCQV